MLLRYDSKLYLIQFDDNKLTLFYTYGKVTFDLDETFGCITIPITDNNNSKVVKNG